MEQASNTFTNGLLLDINPMLQGTDVLSDCLNGTLLTMNGNEVILQNDMGNRQLDKVELPYGFVPVGIAEYGGVIYIASYNPIDKMSEIGCFPSPNFETDSDEGTEIEENNLFSLFIRNESVSGSTRRLYIDKNLVFRKLYDKISPGDKFVVYTNKLKPKLYSLYIGILNSLNVFFDITDKYVNPITYGHTYNTSPSTKNTYYEKLIGPMYLKIKLNIILDYNYSIMYQYNYNTSTNTGSLLLNYNINVYYTEPNNNLYFYEILYNKNQESDNLDHNLFLTPPTFNTNTLNANKISNNLYETKITGSSTISDIASNSIVTLTLELGIINYGNNYTIEKLTKKIDITAHEGSSLVFNVNSISGNLIDGLNNTKQIKCTLDTTLNVVGELTITPTVLLWLKPLIGTNTTLLGPYLSPLLSGPNYIFTIPLETGFSGNSEDYRLNNFFAAKVEVTIGETVYKYGNEKIFSDVTHDKNLWIHTVNINTSGFPVGMDITVNNNGVVDLSNGYVYDRQYDSDYYAIESNFKGKNNSILPFRNIYTSIFDFRDLEIPVISSGYSGLIKIYNKLSPSLKEIKTSYLMRGFTVEPLEYNQIYCLKIDNVDSLSSIAINSNIELYLFINDDDNYMVVNLESIDNDEFGVLIGTFQQKWKADVIEGSNHTIQRYELNIDADSIYDLGLNTQLEGESLGGGSETNTLLDENESQPQQAQAQLPPNYIIDGHKCLIIFKYKFADTKHYYAVALIKKGNWQILDIKRFDGQYTLDNFNKVLSTFKLNLYGIFNSSNTTSTELLYHSDLNVLNRDYLTIKNTIELDLNIFKLKLLSKQHNTQLTDNRLDIALFNDVKWNKSCDDLNITNVSYDYLHNHVYNTKTKEWVTTSGRTENTAYPIPLHLPSENNSNNMIQVGTLGNTLIYLKANYYVG